MSCVALDGIPPPPPPPSPLKPAAEKGPGNALVSIIQHQRPIYLSLCPYYHFVIHSESPDTVSAQNGTTQFKPPEVKSSQKVVSIFLVKVNIRQFYERIPEKSE